VVTTVGLLFESNDVTEIVFISVYDKAYSLILFITNSERPIKNYNLKVAPIY